MRSLAYGAAIGSAIVALVFAAMDDDESDGSARLALGSAIVLAAGIAMYRSMWRDPRAHAPVGYNSVASSRRGL